MTDHMQRVRLIPITKSWEKDSSSLAGSSKFTQFWVLAGTLLYVGRAALPQANLTAWKIQQKLRYLKVGDLLEGSVVIQKL